MLIRNMQEPIISEMLDNRNVHLLVVLWVVNYDTTL